MTRRLPPVPRDLSPLEEGVRTTGLLAACLLLLAFAPAIGPALFLFAVGTGMELSFLLTGNAAEQGDAFALFLNLSAGLFADWAAFLTSFF